MGNSILCVGLDQPTRKIDKYAPFLVYQKVKVKHKSKIMENITRIYAPLPPPPFICIWFDVSLHWSFSLRYYLYTFISFYTSNVYFTHMFLVIFSISLSFICFIAFSILFFGSRLPSGGFWKMNIDFACFQNAKSEKTKK